MIRVMEPELEMRQLRLFLAVAETLHFGRAAESLGIAQPNLSQQIARLESTVGFPLFVRHAKGVSLTPSGEFLKHKAEALTQTLHSTVQTMRRLGSGEVGNIVVGFCGSIMLTRVVNLIREFRAKSPEITLTLRELHVNEQIPLLQEGLLDLCFLRDAGEPENCKVINLLREPYVAVLPTQHPLASRKRLAPELLKDEPFVLFSPEMARLAFDRTVAVCLAHGFQPSIQREAAQWTSLAMLISAGLGVSIAPECVSTMSVPGVCYVPLASEERTCVDVAYRTPSANPSLGHFLDYIARSRGRPHRNCAH